MKMFLSIILLLPIGCGCENPGEKARQRAFDNGREAYRLGIPATANPHKSSHSVSWLDGYVHELRESKK